MITLRLANINDAKKLLDWHNDPMARNNFFNKEIVELNEHMAWLKKVLQDLNRRLFIIVNEDKMEIGQVRFDVNADEAEISITLDKDFRGKGYGAKSIRHGSEKFLKENKQLQRIVARIKPDNKLSLDAFKQAGFLETNRNDLEVYMKFEL